MQGFGQRYADDSGNTVGTIAISANQISRYITFRVSKASLGGRPASGWAFTVVLHGQDGFSSDHARGFAPTPQDFLFGVCAATSNDPHCTANPKQRPEGHRRTHATRRHASRRTRLHAEQPDRAARSDDPLEQADGIRERFHEGAHTAPKVGSLGRWTVV